MQVSRFRSTLSATVTSGDKTRPLVFLCINSECLTFLQRVLVSFHLSGSSTSPRCDRAQCCRRGGDVFETDFSQFCSVDRWTLGEPNATGGVILICLHRCVATSLLIAAIKKENQ